MRVQSRKSRDYKKLKKVAKADWIKESERLDANLMQMKTKNDLKKSVNKKLNLHERHTGGSQWRKTRCYIMFREPLIMFVPHDSIIQVLVKTSRTIQNRAEYSH